MKTAAMSPEDVIRYSENVTIRLVTAIIYSGILLSLSFKKKKTVKEINTHLWFVKNLNFNNKNYTMVMLLLIAWAIKRIYEVATACSMLDLFAFSFISLVLTTIL